MSLKYRDYPEKQFIEIEGIKYSHEMFKGLGGMLPLNVPFEITERKDGVITASGVKKEKG